MMKKHEETHNIKQSSLIKKQKELENINDYVFVSYNKNWGTNSILGSVPVEISLGKKCIIELESTTSYLNAAICKILGTKEVKLSKAKYVTFDVTYSEEFGCYIIDESSFQLYYGRIEQFGELQPCGVFLKIATFISPDGQVWIDESNYEQYINEMNVIFECSDGSLTKTYSDFKVWEKELLLRPNNPNYDILPYQTSLIDIAHQEVASDGTIWRDANILQEYLAWRSNPNHNYQEGYYCGCYGVANSFKEYAKGYNASYFLINDLRREECHYDSTYGLLFSSKKAADDYIERLKSFQKKR